MSEIGLCGTCEHWEPLEEAPTMETGTYPRERAAGRWGWCQKAEQFGPRSGSDKFYVIDGSMYRADLNCREDFGCVEWTALTTKEIPWPRGVK